MLSSAARKLGVRLALLGVVGAALTEVRRAVRARRAGLVSILIWGVLVWEGLLLCVGGLTVCGGGLESWTGLRVDGWELEVRMLMRMRISTKGRISTLLYTFASTARTDCWAVPLMSSG